MSVTNNKKGPKIETYDIFKHYKQSQNEKLIEELYYKIQTPFDINTLSMPDTLPILPFSKNKNSQIQYYRDHQN